MEPTERLQRFLARAGVASRRTAEEMILAGLVAVNGRQVDTLGGKVDASRDAVTVGGRPVVPPARYTYILLNKPVGYVTTMRDPQGRPRAVDLLPPDGPRIYPVGRLDRGTTGLLLLTNDGDLTARLLHPSRGVWKIYRAEVEGAPCPERLARLRRGVILADGPTIPAGVKILARKDGYATLEIRLHEGRKRQIRRMLAAVGHPVLSLHRVAIGPLRLGDLPVGSWRHLTDNEVAALWIVAKRRRDDRRAITSGATTLLRGKTIGSPLHHQAFCQGSRHRSGHGQ